MDHLKPLWDDNYRSLLFYAVRFVKQQDVAEDIVQESFIKAWKADKACKQFLYTCVRNACYDYLRIESIHNRIHQDIALLTEIIENGATDYDEMYAEYIGLIVRLMERLPLRQRKVMELLKKEYTIAEIATELNISQQTVRNLKTMAKDNIREFIEQLKSPR